MKFLDGKPLQWKGKPKSSPLDTDVEFIQLRNKILSGAMKPFESIYIEIYQEADGKRLKTKNPARLVRDRLRRILKSANLLPDYDVSTRETSTPGVWGIEVTHEPREMATRAPRTKNTRQLKAS